MLPRALPFALALLATPLPLLAGATPAAEVRFELAACDYIEALVKVPPAAVDPLVPDHFVLRLAADGMATLAFGVAECAQGRAGAETGPGAYGVLLVRIQPPADPVLAGTDVQVYFYRLEHFTLADDVYARVAKAAGADRIEVDTLAVTIDHALSTMAIAGAAAGVDHDALLPVSPVLAEAPPVAPVRWREFHAVAGGYATLEAILDSGPGAGLTAHLALPRGGLAEALLGPANTGLASYGDAFAIREGRMMVLPRPA